jgi:hypothetical protein
MLKKTQPARWVEQELCCAHHNQDAAGDTDQMDGACLKPCVKQQPFWVETSSLATW